MRLTENQTDNSTLLVDKGESATTFPKSRHRLSSSGLEQMPDIVEEKSLPSPECVYAKVVKSPIKNPSTIEERKRVLKRASWDPTSHQQYGLPPTGKRIDHEKSTLGKTSTRIRMRPNSILYPQLSSLQPTSSARPVSYNERYDRVLLDKISNREQQEPSPSISLSLSSSSSSSSSVDTVLQITTRTSPSLDNSDFISDTSTASSITSTANTITSLSSTIPSRHKTPNYERISSSKPRPLLGEYHLPKDFNQIDYNLLSSISNANTVSPLSSSSSSTSFTCPKGHKELFTSQTVTTDLFRDNNDPLPTTTNTTKCSTMTMSISPNRHRPSRSINKIITSMSPLTNTKSQRDQSDSPIINGSCLKSDKKKTNGVKKSVRFDWHLPTEIRSTRCHDRPSVTVTSSSLSTGSNSDSDNKEEEEKRRKKNDGGGTVFISTTAPLPTHTIHRSFSLSPSPHLKGGEEEEKNNNHHHLDVSRRHRQKENVDELNSPTSRRVTTAAHLPSPITSATDGQTQDSNGTNHFQTCESLTQSSTQQQMPSNDLLVQQPSTTKKSVHSGGFFSFIYRSNSNNSKSLASEDNTPLRQISSSSQRKSKQSSTNGSKRLSTDIDSLHSPSISSVNISKEDTDKVTRNRHQERQSTIDNRGNSSNTDLSLASIIRSSISMAMHPSTTVTIKSSAEDSLNNGLLFQPIQPSIEKEPFFLSTPQSLSSPINDSSTMMQTSTLIISTPPQYHYYLYPPESTPKKTSHTNRNVSNVSMNSVSTNSSSSSSSYEYQLHDLDDDTSSHSKKLSSSDSKPVTLSDCVQAFWPPSLSINNSEQTKLASSVEQNKHSNLINGKHPHLGSNPTASSTYGDDSLSTSNSHQADGFPPTTSLNGEIRAYSEQSSFNNQCLRIANETFLEDSQASYSERLRAKSRSITTHRSMAMNVPPPEGALSRSRSKDQLDNSSLAQRNTCRPKSAGQGRSPGLFSPIREEIYNDFQSKRQFFENRTYTDHSPASASNKTYTSSPPKTTIQNNHHVTKCSWNDSSSRQLPPTPPESLIRTTKYFDASSNQATLLPPAIYRKPIRIVKAVQRSAPLTSINDSQKSMTSEQAYTLPTEHHHLSSEYMRHLFPLPDHLKRDRPKQTDDKETSVTDGAFVHLTKRLEIFKENQRVINEEVNMNTSLGIRLMCIIESKGELNEIEKLKLHINEIDTITSVLLKLSSRLAKVENDLTMINDNNNAHTKTNLLERREKIIQKHDEAKTLKDGIDRRSRLVTNILRKYLSDEQFDDYEYFIRMKSILSMDAKDMEENLLSIQSLLNSVVAPSPDNLQRSDSISSSSSHQTDHLQSNHWKVISTNA